MATDEIELNRWRTIFEREIAGHDFDGAHDIGHIRRVLKEASDIAEAFDDACPLTILAICYLHDAVSVPKDSENRSKASLLSAEYARAKLVELGFPEDKIDNVCHGIAAHSYSAGIPAETLEAKIVSDADKLDALGYIGLARLFHTAGTIGTFIYKADEPWPEQRETEELNYALDHYLVKLRNLDRRMYTDPGRTKARERIETMERFLGALIAEAGF